MPDPVGTPITQKQAQAIVHAIGGETGWTGRVESDPVRFQKTSPTRFIADPARSSAATVESKVGGAGSATTASISALCSAMARS